MVFKTILGFLFFVFVTLLLTTYLFAPFQQLEFGTSVGHTNFSLNSSVKEKMQFYPETRFPNSEISYKIIDCPLKKKEDMVRAFDILANKSILEFYPVKNYEEISVTCDSKNKMEGSLFIAGEGGPTDITQTEIFNVIHHGKILLIKESMCESPNIALHELLHVLGFEHSLNSNNIMYNITECKQILGEEILTLINDLYLIPSYPDLAFGNVSAFIHGRYLDTTIHVKNNGLKISGKTNISIFANGNLVKEIKLDPLEIGHGISIMLNNTWAPTMNIHELDFVIDSDFEELEKNNNRIKLTIKD